MSKKDPVIGVIFMFVFFFLGAIARQVYLEQGTEWLKGIPAFMGALSFLSPILFSRQEWRKKEFWLDGYLWKIPFSIIYILTIAFLIYFGSNAYLA